jgi:DNA-binding CsgD family transcriptional regulator
MPLSTDDYKKIHDILDAIYSSQSRSELFQALCERVERLIGISCAAAVRMDHAAPHFHLPGYLAYNMSPEVIFLFSIYYSALHPAVTGNHLGSLNTAIRTTDIIPAARLAETEYGRDFQPRIPSLYELSCVLGCRGERFGGFTLHRTRKDGDFTDRHKDIFNCIAPHLARALYNIDLHESITSAMNVGVVIMHLDGRLLYMNEKAKSILKGHPVENLINQGSGLSGGHRRTRGRYRVHIIPQMRQQVVVMEPFTEREDLCHKLSGFGLTARQVEVAMLVIRGFSNQEISDELNITEQTVKDHLRAIFSKTRIHRRSELATKTIVSRNRA